MKNRLKNLMAWFWQTGSPDIIPHDQVETFDKIEELLADATIKLQDENKSLKKQITELEELNALKDLQSYRDVNFALSKENDKLKKEIKDLKNPCLKTEQEFQIRQCSNRACRRRF